MEESKVRLYFVHEVMKAITIDHNKRNAQGLEPKRFARRKFEILLEGAYPQIGTSELFNTARKSVISLEEKPALNKGMDFDKVDGLMKYIFHDKDATKWPGVVKLVKSYAGGKFAHYAALIKSEEDGQVEEMMAALGDTSDTPTHLKVLKLYVEEAVSYYLKNTDNMKESKIKIEELKKREAKLEAAIKAAISRMENRTDLSPQEKLALKKAKELL